MVWLWGAAVLLNSALLFWLELMVAKLLRPYLGGSAAVWNTCLMLFQITLVTGYCYAHLTTIHLGKRSSTILHLGLLLAAAVTLPISGSVSVQGDTPLTAKRLRQDESGCLDIAAFHAGLSVGARSQTVRGIPRQHCSGKLQSGTGPV